MWPKRFNMKKNFIYLIVAFVFFTVSCNRQKPQICQGDDGNRCENYLETWEDYFLEVNDMTLDYFEEHIEVIEANMKDNTDGKNFNIRYLFKVDWLEIEVRDQFQVYKNVDVDKFPQLQLPDTEYFQPNKVFELLDIFAFESHVTRVASVENLKFTSKSKALGALKDITGEDVGFRRYEFKNARLTYDPFTQDPYIDTASGERGAHPYMYGVKEVGDDECVCGEIDLVSGKGGPYPCECEIQ